MPHTHNSWAEGARLGLVVATGIWLWIAGVDVVAGEPLIVEFAFAMLTVLLSHLGLGQLAWVRILGGNLVGVAIALLVLSRRHPLAAELRKAETHEEENE